MKLVRHLLFISFLPLAAQAQELGARVPGADSAAVLSGAVAVNTISTGEILVALDEKPADGVADYEFVLQQEEPFETVSGHYDTARVLVRDDQIRISTPSGDAILLIMRGATPRLTGPRDQWLIVEGAGLSRSWGGGFGHPIDVVASESYHRQSETLKGEGPPEKPEGGTVDLCSGGGVGANSCSITCEGNPSQCSTSCNSGKYACCYCETYPFERAWCKCFNNP